MAEKVPSINLRWQQGEDLKVELIYKEGDDPKTAVAVPLATNYSLRLDLVLANGTVVTSLTSDDDEVTLSNGGPTEPNIIIYVPRGLTLPPNGDVYEQMELGNFSFGYDVFLRNDSTDKQIKILRGTITTETSHTLWQ